MTVTLQLVHYSLNGHVIQAYGQAGGSPLSSYSMDESCRDTLKWAGADGWTPLLQAAERADLATVKELAMHRPNVKARTKVPVPPLSC